LGNDSRMAKLYGRQEEGDERYHEGERD